MKKLISIIMALAVCASAMTISAGTATAAEINTEAVEADASAVIDSDLQTELDKMSASQTVAVKANLVTDNADYSEIVAFAEKNGMGDKIKCDEDGNLTECPSEVLYAFMNYYAEIMMSQADENYSIVKSKYSQSVLVYDKLTATVVCIATKSQVNSMASSGAVSYIELADETYADVENGLTWTEYNNIIAKTRAYKTAETGVQYTESNSNVSASEFISDTCVGVTFVEGKMDYTEKAVVKRSDDIVWIQEMYGGEIFLYENGTVYTAGELYNKGNLTLSEFKMAGGMYFCDVNGDDISDVNDVTYLQLYLANGSTNGSNLLLTILTDVHNAYCDVNFDGNLDVNDVTTIQMYLAGYDV